MDFDTLLLNVSALILFADPIISYQCSSALIYDLKKLLFFQAKEKGVSGLQIGFIFGAFALVNVIFSPIFGKFVSILSYSPFCEAPSPKAYPTKRIRSNVSLAST